jgi:hypothetical protein
MTNPILNLFYGIASRLSKIKPYYWVLACLLALSGWIGMGIVGLLLAFWTLLLWYSVWQRPYRFEMFFLAALGLVGAVIILPEEQWLDANKVFLLAFMAIAMSPIIDLFIRLFRSTRDE